jgi:hypothetical protein
MGGDKLAVRFHGTPQIAQQFLVAQKERHIGQGFAPSDVTDDKVWGLIASYEPGCTAPNPV